MNGPGGPQEPIGGGPDDSRWENGGWDGGGTPPHGVPLPRVPLPRGAADDGPPIPVMPPAAPPALDHSTLRSLLGAWALSACAADENTAVEEHLGRCVACADEARRLRDAVRLLRNEDQLDLDPTLRHRVLAGCLGRRPARVPVPSWAVAYDAEAARLDALLADLGPDDWRQEVVLRWHQGRQVADVASVIGHLTAVDGLVAAALDLEEPLGPGPDVSREPRARTETYWKRFGELPPGRVRETWRDQGRSLVRTVAFAGNSAGGLEVDYGGPVLALEDAFLDRAFECWIHADDIAEAVGYPYEAPAPRHLHGMIDLAARLLPTAIAGRRRAGLATSPGGLTAAGEPGRSLYLEVEGDGGGEWYIPLDSPAAKGCKEHSVAHVALDGVEFCQLAAGHRTPEELAAGIEGDAGAVHDVLSAAASMSRL
ncbi:maleylpyruvate isomerase N-terminal domain-containing protein [Streptantibioticus silvisoli]|uniref:maleylpyruvate isomerase N-terminal domain-containing protein n=1 Tax=Streptantibioticus silvisoli TaxID=2705255 RepID=UPI003558F0D5